MDTLLEGVLPGEDDVFEWALVDSDQLLLGEVVFFFEVVDVVDLEEDVLFDARVVGEFDAFGELGVQGVHDDFGLSDLPGLVVDHFVDYDHGVCKREGVHLYEVLA